jgi:hypothetical protein
MFFQATEANQVKLTLEQVCATLGAAASTAALRLRELRAALATVGQALPWGRDITESSVKEHLPMILQLLRLSGEVGSQDRALIEHAGSLEALGEGRGAAGAIEAAPRGEDRGSAETVAKQVAPVVEIGGGAVSLHENGATSGSTAKLLKTDGLDETSGREATGISAKPDTGKYAVRGGVLKGRSQNGKKRARDSDHRAGTPENMEVGPLGSYLKLRKTLGSSPEKEAESAGGEISPSDRKGLEGTAQQTGTHDVRTPIGCTPIDLESEAKGLGVREEGGVSAGSQQVEEPDWKERLEPPEAGGRKELVTDGTESDSTSIGKVTESRMGAIAARLPDAPRSDTSCDWKTESEPADLKGAPSLLPHQSVQQSGSLRASSVQDSRGVPEDRESQRPLQPSSVSSIGMIQQDRAKICAPMSRTPHGGSVDYTGRSIESAWKNRVPPLHRQSEETIDVFEPEYVKTPALEHVNRPEIVSYPDSLQVPGIEQSAAYVQKPLTETQHTARFSKQAEEVANYLSVVTVQPMGTTDRDGVQTFPSSEVQGPGGEEFEAVPFGDWSGLPPSFRAQAIERQRCVLSTRTEYSARPYCKDILQNS